MPGLFGAPEGDIAAIQSMQGLAQAQGQQLANQKSALELQEQQGMARMLQQQNAQGGMQGDPAQQLEAMANMALKSGYVSSGAKLATDAATLRLKGAQTTHAKAQSFEQQALAAKTELDMADRLLGGVTDASSWNSANQLFEQMTGRPSPFSQIPYSPELVQQLRQQTLTLKDQLEIGIKKQNAETARMNAEGNQDFRSFRKEYLSQDLQIKKDRESRLRKQGGRTSDVGAPAKGELDRAADLVQEQYPNLPQDEVNGAAYTVASRARAIRKQNAGVDAESAFQRALQESQGDFKTLDENYKIAGIPLPFGSKQTTHFREGGGKGGGAGKSMAAPIPNIPQDPAQRTVGAYYSHGGKIYQWQKGGWKAMNKAAPVTTPVGEDDGSAE